MLLPSLSAGPSVCLPTSLSAYQSACLPVCLSARLALGVCVSVQFQALLEVEEKRDGGSSLSRPNLSFLGSP